MPTIEAGEGNCPAQVSPFQEQLKSPKQGRNKCMLDPRPKAQVSDYPLIDCSGSPETSERPPSEFQLLGNKTVENGTEQPLTSRKSAGSNLGSSEHENKANKDPDEHHGKSRNHKLRTRFESDVDSTGDTNREFRQEVSKLTSQHDDTSRNEKENSSKICSNVPAPRSVYDNNPLSATSHPLHIDILKEKMDSTVTESMPRIVPPKDVQSDLETTYRNMLLPFSSRYSKELHQPLLEDRTQSFIEGKCSKSDRCDSTNLSFDENADRSFRDWLCC